jgi:hypothetical protein
MRGELFFQYGIENYRGLTENENFLIFYSNSMISKLLIQKTWCIDGTFSVVPKPYYQILTISFIRHVHVFPVIFCILKNKFQNTYVELFNTILMLVGPMVPEFIKTDFEIAIINSLHLIFPRSKISTCQFHLGQILQRKLKSLNIFNEYKRSPVVKKFTKALTALCYVEKSRMVETFEALKSQNNFPIILEQVYCFFERNFISNETARYPIDLWHSLDLINYGTPKTNNAIEAWHNVFNSTFGTSRYNFILLISKLREEEEVIKQKFLRSIAGENLPRIKRYVEMENNHEAFINNTTEKFGAFYVFDLVSLLFY